MRLSASSHVSRQTAASPRPVIAPTPPLSKLAKLQTFAAAAAVSRSLLTSGVCPAQAADLNTLAEVMRPTFSFVDSNKDGIVTLQELQQLSTQVRSWRGRRRRDLGTNRPHGVDQAAWVTLGDTPPCMLVSCYVRAPYSGRPLHNGQARRASPFHAWLAGAGVRGGGHGAAFGHAAQLHVAAV